MLVTAREDGSAKAASYRLQGVAEPEIFALSPQSEAIHTGRMAWGVRSESTGPHEQSALGGRLASTGNSAAAQCWLALPKDKNDYEKFGN